MVVAHNQRDDLYLSSEESSEGELGKENRENRKSTLSSEEESSEIDEDSNSISLSNSPSLISYSNDRRVKSKRKMILPPGLALSTSEQGKRNPLLVDLDDSEEIVKKKRKIESWFGSDEIQVRIVLIIVSSLIDLADIQLLTFHTFIIQLIHNLGFATRFLY